MTTLAALALVLFQMAPSHATNPHAAPPEGNASLAPASVVPPVPPSQPEKAGGLAWTNPKGWTTAPASSMRVVTLKVPAAPGDAEGGELAIFYFGPGQGGEVDANVQRWFGQFQADPKGSGPKQSKSKVGDVAVTLCQIDGTYVAGMGGTATPPKTGWTLRGAIAEGPGGNVFFKLVGPRKTIEKAQSDFDALVRSLRKG